MHNKPAIAPRSVREAFGPYARLELHRPAPAWRRVVRALMMFATAIVLGAAFGWLLTLWPRMSP